MTITHSKLLSPAGNKTLILMPVGMAGPPTADNPKAFDLVAWETEKNEPQELECLVYPKFAGDSQLPAINANGRTTWSTVQLDITWSMGAGDRANAQDHSTTQQVADDIFGLGNFSRTQAWLPDNGLKFRIAARRLRVRARVPFEGPCAMVISSVQPVIGGLCTPPLPSILRAGDTTSGPVNIPLGAREFRAAPTQGGPLGTIQFRHPLSNFTFGGSPIYPPVFFLFAECADWRPVPPGAATVTSDNVLGALLFR